MAYSGAYQPPALPTDVPDTPPKLSASRPLFSGPSGGKGNVLGALMQKMKAIDLDGDDLLMLLILYLMFRESGDKEPLILMGALLLG